MSDAESVPRVSRRSWLVWGVGAGVYILAVFHRSTLGVAGAMAADRLDLSAGQLSTFIVLQLGLYAAMQVPTGLLVDRFGPRRMLLVATLTMGSAEIAFAFVTKYPLALMARGLLGVGDAMTYIAVLRLAAGWFPAREYPMITSYTGLLGAVGGLAATIPLTGVLNSVGWTRTFAVTGALSVLYAILLIRKATAAPFREVAEVAAAGPTEGSRVWAEVRAAWRMPGGRLGFWVHLTTMAAPVAFGSLWGFPYLTQVVGFSDSGAASMMLIMVLVGVGANLSIGRLMARTPHWRTPVAAAVSVACLIGWVVIVAWPGEHPPRAVVVAIVIVFAIGGPASAVGFMLARDFNPRHRISTATGLVNIGGFVGAVIGVFAVGQVLDWVDGPRAVHTGTAYRWAFGTLAALTAFGLWRLLTWWLRARAVVLLAAARGEPVPVQIVPHRWEMVDNAILAREAAVAELAAHSEHGLAAIPTLAQRDGPYPATWKPIDPAGLHPSLGWTDPEPDENPTGPIPVVKL